MLLSIGTAIVSAAYLVSSALPPTTPSPAMSVAGSGAPLAVVAAGSGAAGDVVVNEFAPGTYVELRNVSESTVDISGFNLWLCGPNDVTTTVRVGLGQRLDAGGFYVVASSSFTGAPVDQTHTGVLPGGGAVLLDPDFAWADGTAVVADSPCGEGAPAPACSRGSTARDVVSTDTGSNVADFSCRTRSPGEPNR